MLEGERVKTLFHAWLGESYQREHVFTRADMLNAFTHGHLAEYQLKLDEIRDEIARGDALIRAELDPRRGSDG